MTVRYKDHYVQLIFARCYLLSFWGFFCLVQESHVVLSVEMLETSDYEFQMWQDQTSHY